MLAERLFSMQTTSAPTMGREGSGGIPEWTPALAAACCAGNMPKNWYNAARLKYALDWSVANDLEYAVWMDAALIAAREKWKIPTGREYIRKMSGLAIAETAAPAKYKHNVIKIAWIGCSQSEWSRTWNKRYNAIYAIPNDWASCALQHVNKRLTEL